MAIQLTHYDHVGVRVADLAVAEAFYAKLGFFPDPAEQSTSARVSGLVSATGLRIHLIGNGQAAVQGNVLMDMDEKLPGYTHAAFVVEDFDELLAWLAAESIPITEGPSVFGKGRRRVCFIRDPDLNVIEFNGLL